MCTSSRRARNFWFLATKSVSQFSSTSAALPPFTLSPSRPCFFCHVTLYNFLCFLTRLSFMTSYVFFARLSFMPLFGYFTCDVLRPCNFDAFASPKAWEWRVNGVLRNSLVERTAEVFHSEQWNSFKSSGSLWQWTNLSLLCEPLLYSGSIVASFSKCLILGKI